MVSSSIRSQERSTSLSGVFLTTCFLSACVPAAFAQSVLWEKIGPPIPPLTGGTGFAGVFDAGADLTGDGVRDVVAGAPAAGPSGVVNQGQVLVYSGVDGTLIHSVAGPLLNNAALGEYVLFTGDLDGDGLSEFAASTNGGPVFVYSGGDASLLLSIPAPTSWTASKWRPLSTADVDVDGIPDLVLGCSTCNAPAGGASGGVAIVSGSSGAPLQVWPGTAFMGRFGWSVANAGDMNGDGLVDLVVGAPGFQNVYNPMQTWTTGSFVEVRTAATGSLIYTWSPVVPGCPSFYCLNPRFGWSVGGGGDVDGDGFPDAIVGRTVGTGVAVPSVQPGVTVFSGATGAVLYDSTDGLGQSVRMLGDVDGDGFDDWLATDNINGQDACTTIGGVLGCGVAKVFSGVDSTMIYDLRRQGSSAFGFYAAATGDLDGDDVPDLAASDPFWSANPMQLPYLTPGRLTVFSLIPEGVEVFGGGCSATSGGVPRIGIRGSPKLGGVVKVHISKASAGAAAFFLFGVSNTSWGSAPLPLDLASFGMPGCSLLVAGDFVFPMVTQTAPPAPGRATVMLTVPADPLLLGAEAFVQWVVAGPAGFTSGAVTRGVRLTIS